MRFKNRRNNSIPVLNLVPMLDVLMTVLTFFIVISMTLTIERGVEVELPNSDEAAPPEDAAPPPAPLIVKLDSQGQVLFNDQSATQAQLEPQMQAYLSSNAKGFVVLQADPNMPYEDVVRMLGNMKKIGGDRVSLAIE